MLTHLIWFRSDLRLYDNLALSAACSQEYAKVLALFIATPKQWRQHLMAPRQAAYMLIHLNNLRNELAKKGIPLLYTQVSNFSAQIEKIQEICTKYKVTHLFYNYQYEFNEQQRDSQLSNKLSGVICHGFHDSVILAPGTVMTNNYEMYKVFTQFKKTWLKCLKKEIPKCVAAPTARKSKVSVSEETITFDYPQEKFDNKLFPISEKIAITKLYNFCQNSAIKYKTQKDFPAIEGTSRLSACLTLGILSPRQCLHNFLIKYPKALDDVPQTTWLNQLIWREFYRHLVAHHPRLCKYYPFVSWTNNIQWKRNKTEIKAWKEGKTGFPIVDAAMHQLNTTGWMHNRLRMISASFLVKDLLVDWRVGERYFTSRLIDGDFSSNNGSWQWAASTGTDAAPYFRIFNPTVQGEKFDNDGEFIYHWLPNLKKVPKKAIHTPWKWADEVGITLDYPRPIVNHQQARINTIKTYEVARNMQNYL